MKRLLLLLLPIILSAQVIDTVIPLLDEPRENLIYIPLGNKLYIYFDNTCQFLVFDCSTYSVRKIIQIPLGYPSAVYGVWNWRRDKIYIAFNIEPESIVVIDNKTDSIIKWINFHTIGTPCYNSRDDKIYVFGQGSVAVIDCETDSIIKIITQPYHLSRFVLWDSIGNKVYCGSGLFDDRVTAINCVNDSVVAVISTNVETPLSAVYSSQRRKLYIGGEWGNVGAVIDAIADTLIKNFYSIVYSWEVPLIWNGFEDKVYWPNDADTIHIIDCQNDSIIKNVNLCGFIECMCLANWSNRLYAATENYDSIGRFNILCIIDCYNDSVISQLRFGKNVEAMTYNPIDQRIYITDQWDSALYVFRDEIPGIVESQKLEVKCFMPEIYPNPAKGVLLVRITLPEKEIKIFDASGKLVKVAEKVISEQEHMQEIRISLKGINSGIYFLRVGKKTKKFLVLK